jgi:hypothetical protein
MRDETRKRLAALIAEELADKIKINENLKSKLEAFTDLPVDKVADAILKQFEYLLSSDLRDLIIHLVMQEAREKSEPEPVEIAAPEVAVIPPAEVIFPPIPESIPAEVDQPPQQEVVAGQPPAEPEPLPVVPAVVSRDSAMTFFGHRETFDVDPISFEVGESDWLYIFGFSYAPKSEGKGIPTMQLRLKGVDQHNPLFLLDYGDVRFYLSRLSSEDYPPEKSGRLTIPGKKALKPQYYHEMTLNELRGQEMLVSLPFWTITRGRDHFIRVVEDNYVELLRALIDVHDAVDWDVDVLVYDEFLSTIPSIAGATKEQRESRREGRTAAGKKGDVKVIEKVIFKEKSLAQEIHSQLLVNSTKGRIEHIISLEGAFMDDWKSILSARYAVGKEKRKAFCSSVMELQTEHAEFEVMFRLKSPTARFSFTKL